MENTLKYGGRSIYDLNNYFGHDFIYKNKYFARIVAFGPDEFLIELDNGKSTGKHTLLWLKYGSSKDILKYIY